MDVRVVVLLALAVLYTWSVWQAGAVQDSAELRLPVDAAELRAAASQARRGHSLAGAEMLLEMRAQLSTAVPWAPMVGLHDLNIQLDT